jgi:hypothetical protein
MVKHKEEIENYEIIVQQKDKENDSLKNEFELIRKDLQLNSFRGE